MIVVVGQAAYLETAAGADAAGIAARIAYVSAGRGHAVQFVGKLGEDDAGDAVVLAFARSGVGHVAMLREPGRSTLRLEPANDSVQVGGSSDESPSVSATPIPPIAQRNLPTLDAGDVDLALRYLTEFAVLVLADRADPDMARVVAAATSWSEARLVVIVPAGGSEPAGLPPDAIVFEAPDDDPDGIFATMVGWFAAALDDGDDPGAAFRSSVESVGWTRAAGA